MQAMGVSLGEIVTLKLTHVEGYACWGSVGNQTGFVHCVEWSWEGAAEEFHEPCVGDEIPVKVFHIVEGSKEPPSADVTYNGKFNVDFAGSIREVHPEKNPWYDPSVYKVDDIFIGTFKSVNSWACFVQHPRGAEGALTVDGVAHGFEVGQQVQVRIIEVDPERQAFDVALCTSDSNS